MNDADPDGRSEALSHTSSFWRGLDNAGCRGLDALTRHLLIMAMAEER